MSTERWFIDTNVFLRALLDDHPDQSPRATAFLERVLHGEVRASTSPTVVMEIVFVMEKALGVPPSEIRDALTPVIAMESLALDDKGAVLLALGWYVEHRVPFADAYHAATANRRGIPVVCSFDRHFDRFPDIRRVEP